jgi:putative glutamine amidotransferase
MAAGPVIGLCAALERASWGVWTTPAHLLPREYADAVQRAGGIAVILPPDPRAGEHADEVLDLLDGLILAGGSDIDPGAYGQRPHPATLNTNPERDAFELALARAAIVRDLPFLGVCRGMQVLNVARGGTLLQHLPESHGHEDHRRTPGTFEGADHQVRLQAGSLAARAAGEESHRTLSHHHQGVDRVGDGLVVTGHSDLDDLPEAVELPGHRFVLGVQWHPEADETSRLIASLVDDARDYAGARSTRASSSTGNGGGSSVLSR